MKQRYTYLTLAILTTIIIFVNSLMPANISSEQSGFFVGMVRKVLTFFKIDIGNINLSLLVRKTAHFIFFFLASLFWHMFFKTLMNREPYEPYTLTLNIGLLIAMTDEFIQYFTPGRAMMVEDILLDLAGVATLLLMMLTISLIKRKRKR